MLENVAVSGMDGRQSGRRGARRRANTRDESIRDYVVGNCLLDLLRKFSALFLLDTHFRFRAVLLDTPIPVEMHLTSIATTKVRTLLDTYFDPRLLDTQMRKSAPFGALIVPFKPAGACAVCFVKKRAICLL
jgi:hypothetical protein